MFKERDQRCSDRRDLCRRHVHKFNLIGSYDREVGVKTCFHTIVHERSVIIHGSITLSDDLAFFNFGCQVDYIIVVQIHLAVLNLAVGSLNESEIIDLGIDAERRDKTDVRAFRGLNRTETAIVGIVYVSNLEAGTLT